MPLERKKSAVMNVRSRYLPSALQMASLFLSYKQTICCPLQSQKNLNHAQALQSQPRGHPRPFYQPRPYLTSGLRHSRRPWCCWESPFIQDWPALQKQCMRACFNSCHTCTNRIIICSTILRLARCRVALFPGPGHAGDTVDDLKPFRLQGCCQLQTPS